MLYFFLPFLLHNENKSIYLQCCTFELGEMARQITLLRAFFMLRHCLLYRIVPSRVEC